MFSSKKEICQLMYLMNEYRITTVVTCPGSRNSPIVQSFYDNKFNCYNLTDERSAGFFAIGMALRLKEPIVVCCTSGSALLNLYPAVAEAYYQQIPLIIVSADRPAAWIGQMDGQTCPQPGVFGNFVRCSVSLPPFHTAEDEWHSNRLINEALIEACYRMKGPVHINIPIEEPFFEDYVTDIFYKKMNLFKASTVKDFCEGLKNKYARIMIICGQQEWMEDELICPLEEVNDHETLFVEENIANRYAERWDKKCEALHCVDKVLAVVENGYLEEFIPDVIIYLGGHIISNRLKKFFRKHPPKEQYRVSGDGKITDLFGKLDGVVEMNDDDFIKDYLSIPFANRNEAADYSTLWTNVEEDIPATDFAYSEMSAIGKLIAKLPQDSMLHLANSSAVRYAQLYNLPASVNVFSNRGINGIEGSLSTAMGMAGVKIDPLHSIYKENRLHFIVIGDLSFFYDMNALWNNYCRSTVRILLINNGGGEIFYTLNGVNKFEHNIKAIAGEHNTSAEDWGKSRGFDYLKVTNDEELQRKMNIFTALQHTCPQLMEVFTDKNNDVKLLKAFYNQLKKYKLCK